MTDAQKSWMEANPNYQTCGPPRAGVKFIECGTLYADGRFEKMGGELFHTVRLEEGCKLVGIKVHPNT